MQASRLSRAALLQAQHVAFVRCNVTFSMTFAQCVASRAQAERLAVAQSVDGFRSLRRGVFGRVRQTTLAEIEGIKREASVATSSASAATEVLERTVNVVGPSAVLGAYQELRSLSVGHSEALAVLQGPATDLCLPENYLVIASPTFIDLQACTLRFGHPLDAISTGVRALADVRGKDWSISVEKDEDFDAAVTIHVRKCFYNDYFSRHNVSDLTSLFCAAELACGRRVEKFCHGRVRMTNTEKIADGYKACRLRFQSRVKEGEEEPAKQT